MKSKKIFDLQKEIKRLKSLLIKDELTGVLNRRGFKEELSRILKEVIFYKIAKETRKKIPRKKFLIKDFSVLFIDIDGLKKTNDIYGHKAGDKLIKTVAHIIESNIRETDFAGRLAGDEFIVALLGSSEKDAYKIAEKIRKSVETSKKLSEFDKIQPTLSIGVAEVTGLMSENELIERADTAMYEAKHKRGKNNTVKYSEIS